MRSSGMRRESEGVAVAAGVMNGGDVCARWLGVGETEEEGGRAASEGEDRGATGRLQALEWGRGGSRRWKQEVAAARLCARHAQCQ